MSCHLNVLSYRDVLGQQALLESQAMKEEL